MKLSINIPHDAEAVLRAKADAAGTDLASFAETLLIRWAKDQPTQLHELTAVASQGPGATWSADRIDALIKRELAAARNSAREG